VDEKKVLNPILQANASPSTEQSSSPEGFAALAKDMLVYKCIKAFAIVTFV
jgi:hypothetical protein